LCNIVFNGFGIVLAQRVYDEWQSDKQRTSTPPLFISTRVSQLQAKQKDWQRQCIHQLAQQTYNEF
jgi:hypothetical protein